MLLSEDVFLFTSYLIGISGKKEGRKTKSRANVGEGAMARISAMIPPPPKSEDQPQVQDLNSDDDWSN